MNFFQDFFMIYQKSSSFPNKYLSKNCPIGGFFLNFFTNFFFDWWSSPNKYLSKISANGSDFFRNFSIFFLLDHFRTGSSPNKYLSINVVPRAAFSEFFSFFFPAAWVCWESKLQNKEKCRLIIENKRLANLLILKLHGNVCTRQR